MSSDIDCEYRKLENCKQKTVADKIFDSSLSIKEAQKKKKLLIDQKKQERYRELDIKFKKMLEDLPTRISQSRANYPNYPHRFALRVCLRGAHELEYIENLFYSYGFEIAWESVYISPNRKGVGEYDFFIRDPQVCIKGQGGCILL